MKNANSIERGLLQNGHMTALAKKEGKSLSSADRRIILKNREKAKEAGFSQKSINALEMEGEKAESNFCAEPISARFIGLQDMSNGLKFRFYNIEGNHPLNNSTVSVTTLVRNGIRPLDISLVQIVKEVVKENMFMGYLYAANLWYGITERVWAKVR